MIAMNLSKYKGVVRLGHKVTLYVPSTVNVKDPAGDERIRLAVERVALRFSDWFGGATSTPASGYWAGAAGLVHERVTIVFAYASEEALGKHVEDVFDLANELKRDLTQESVALEVDGEMYLL